MSGSDYYMYHPQEAGSAPLQGQTAVFRPSKPADWEPYRDAIAHYYITMNMKLKDVMPEMETTYFFKATEKQYKTQIKKWNLDTKYIKSSEYMFMIKTMRERKAQDSTKETRFILRGRVVDPKDIARFEKRAQRKGQMKEGEAVDAPEAEPVEDLVYGTPPPDEAYQTYDAEHDEYDDSAECMYSY
ncbi:hypothetical protein BT67DRAFT_307261 [Trichocladium antarcticum]|uniref:Clr5 domain-containing protein n=1 Tax=Trichocladium antarcticum TaxID=1450529 RepID=A0AAN6UJL8_9PEZI|nr:hypothetical protein BT67DRAFT_307261 [Trichocladium antarcticum]